MSPVQAGFSATNLFQSEPSPVTCWHAMVEGSPLSLILTTWTWIECIPPCISFLGLPTNDHKLCGLKQQKVILSQFLKLEVQNQDVDEVMLFLKVLRRILSCLSLASGGCQQSLGLLSLKMDHSSTGLILHWVLCLHSLCLHFCFLFSQRHEVLIQY